MTSNDDNGRAMFRPVWDVYLESGIPVDLRVMGQRRCAVCSVHVRPPPVTHAPDRQEAAFEGNMSELNPSQGNLSQGNLSQGNLSQGNPPEVNPFMLPHFCLICYGTIRRIQGQSEERQGVAGSMVCDVDLTSMPTPSIDDIAALLVDKVVLGQQATLAESSQMAHMISKKLAAYREEERAMESLTLMTSVTQKCSGILYRRHDARIKHLQDRINIQHQRIKRQDETIESQKVAMEKMHETIGRQNDRMESMEERIFRVEERL